MSIPMQNVKYIVIFITCSSKEETDKIKDALLEKKLAACVNIISEVGSYFRWQGKIDSAREILLLVKTKKSALNKIIKLVKQFHSYEVPEIIAFPIVGGNKEYLDWINNEI